MVGVPRSTGCTLCVKRRVKCDQGRPSCGNCAKYGAACPGYDRGAKFVDGKHQVRARRQHGAAALAGEKAAGRGRSIPPNSWEVILRGPDSPAQAFYVQGDEASSDASMCTHEPVVSTYTIDLARRLPGAALGFPGSKPMNNPPLPRSVLLASLMDNLRMSTPETEGLFFEHYITAQHLGKKEVLDNALSAFTAHALGKASSDPALLIQSRILYGKALFQLQRALDHATEWKSPETLCSAMMCCTYELFAGTERPDTWMEHAAGVAWLIQTRGPQGYSTTWEKSMFLSFRGLIIMRSLFRLEECFLARKRWQKLLLGLAVEEEGDTPAVRYDKTTNLWLAHLARVPNVLRQGLALKTANDRGLPIDIGQAMAFAQETEALRLDCKVAYGRFKAVLPEPTEVPSMDPTSPYPVVLRYANPWYGCNLIGYWATMLILQECLNQCRWPVDFTEENRQFARNIYRSLETVGDGLMGPFRVGFAMRVSYDFAHVTVQRYIHGLLQRYEKLYAATTAKTYPKTEPNEYNYM